MAFSGGWASLPRGLPSAPTGGAAAAFPNLAAAPPRSHVGLVGWLGWLAWLARLGLLGVYSLYLFHLLSFIGLLAWLVLP